MRVFRTPKGLGATCSWSCAAISVATARPASADPTGTSSTTRVASVGSSTSARPATRRVLWPPKGQDLWGSMGKRGAQPRTRRNLAAALGVEPWELVEDIQGADWDE